MRFDNMSQKKKKKKKQVKLELIFFILFYHHIAEPAFTNHSCVTAKFEILWIRESITNIE